ncbi:ScyD/ScyE family protein [Nocardioides mesophilus]|uniref:ScyD/ScyE family protein n=1 Tax=Nocardioides mesophilus TaxID=433659 RepID=A0A7G9RC66_9ACTN|nr:ScyD/ScyE family protein [Nocardioides mesophilus]QNN53191.1 ScyD/ScyE family protein [Nocardioides mesophilus]
MRRTRILALLSAGLVATSVAGLSAVGAASGVEANAAARAAIPDRIDGLNGPRGLDIAATGRAAVAETGGAISLIVRSGPAAGTLRHLGHVPTDFPAAVAMGRRGSVWALTTGHEGKGSATLFRFDRDGTRHKVANLARWASHHPDPFDLENEPTDSNPFGLAPGPHGSMLVADAGANAVTQVWPSGRIELVARVQPRVVRVPEAIQTAQNLPAKVPAEAVTTSVAMGAHGAVYIGELRGFPGTPKTSEVWRVRPGARGVVCRPAAPFSGPCKRAADRLTSVVSLDLRSDGALYVAELSKLSWVAIESKPPVPGADIGAVIRISPDRTNRRELKPGQVHLPGEVAVDSTGRAYVSGPIFGPGSVFRVD